MQYKNWDKYRRKQNIFKKSNFNPEVSELLTSHYKYLYTKLVKSDQDRDTFNDTFLKMTNKYNPDKDFIDQFVFWFRRLKGEYIRDDRVTNYHQISIEEKELDFPDIVIEDVRQTKKHSLNELKNKILDANTKKAKEKDS